MTQRRLGFIFLVILLGLISFFPSSLMAAPPKQNQLANITFPTNNAVVRGVISIRGNAVHPQFNRFQVAYAQEPVTRNDQWQTIGIERTDPVVNGELAIWDTNQVADGSYSLRLRVIKNDGNYDETEVKQIVVANTVPTATPTPAEEGDEETPVEGPSGSTLVTATPTPLPPTPTIIIEVDVDETATPRPLTTTLELPTPRPENANALPIPTISGFDTSALQSAFLWGVGGMFLIFMFFGLLSLTRYFIVNMARRGRK